MGQMEILELLKKEKKWLSTKEVAKKLNVSSPTRPLGVLFKSNEIKRRQIQSGSCWGFQWKIK